MATIFLDQVHQDTDQLDSALAKQDHDTLVRIAHSLQSTASYMGFAATLGKDLKQMEKEAAKPDPDLTYLRELFQKIQGQAKSASSFIRNEYLEDRV